MHGSRRDERIPRRRERFDRHPEEQAQRKQPKRKRCQVCGGILKGRGHRAHCPSCGPRVDVGV